MENMKNKINENEEEESLKENDFNELNDELNKLQNSNLFDNNKNNINKYKQYNIYFYLYINKDNIFILPIQSDFFNVNKQYTHELIKNSVKKINEQKFIIKYNSINYIISLKDIEDDEENMDFYSHNYELKICKKTNFFPKDDAPCYCPDSLLKNIEKENISFILKNSLNVMLRKNIDIGKENENIFKYVID